MKKYIVIAIVAVLATLNVEADGVKRAVTIQQLPAQAQEFLTKYFADKTFAYAVAEDQYYGTEYDVYYSDGTEIEFRGDGTWKDVECKFAPVPEAIVPQAIKTYLASSQYATGQYIKEIHRKVYGWEIELSSGIEMKFNAGGQFMGIDD